MSLHVVAMCTHNRTRSVIIGALLGSYLADAGLDTRVSTAGMADRDLPVTDSARTLLAGRGIDVADHRSCVIDDSLMSTADLVITAEVQNVVFVGGQWEGSFARTFTLPELVQRGEAVGARSGAPLGEWLKVVSEGRPAGFAYMTDPTVLEVPDPSAQPASSWRATFDGIDQMCRRLAVVLT